MVSTRHQTKLARDAASASQVFQTAELLEMILLYVCEDSARTAFLSRRVNTFFKSTISGSVQLQQALCLRSAQPTSDKNASDIIINPIFDITDTPLTQLYIEIYNFGHHHVVSEDYDPLFTPLTPTVDIWCEDAILGMRAGPLLDMVLLGRGKKRICAEVYFRLRGRDGDMPEAVRVPVGFGERAWERVTVGDGGWRRITVRDVVERARRKLGEWYPEVYGGEERVEPSLDSELGFEIRDGGQDMRWV
ncbi:hypothetical protein PRZ48_014266 [Zasmidium cellare]|uniref:F-box domain-containing protein n=1 Tax=Zasmidium cellare TaxID=395010 RepID=A0ABR0E0G7_ZASCE|nr:hypothetical protein PRZ48_014266 [Zasmidium cellare]